ncbi:CYTH domain-containing protein [Alkalilimnicola sp. S0819]|uniref:CYTH domain-containing protein n=1 Tax=Alkalilimnicola sp. S0819 TaxID=2613922 RepID=UPI00126297BF|nr:CYTH domain-containing protein [Alkalilimnicola sp. S0819]KAB7627451.1 CYTH domain-containing protein [Alkalilimnicola sp. S0819]MPQ15600.1 CYTH domain-containing protein [Alkalilimnicola sp. S0819]
MAEEIERKFLLLNEDWRGAVQRSVAFAQGYLLGARQASVRVRIEGEQANLNIKGVTLGVRRAEYEYPIPLADAREMLDTLCEGPLIEKTRHYVEHQGHTWEIDEFHGDNAGLRVAEIELAHEDEPFARPGWLGAEVSGEARYYNVMLVKHPYREWRDE